jgi:hypothetical protein
MLPSVTTELRLLHEALEHLRLDEHADLADEVDRLTERVGRMSTRAEALGPYLRRENAALEALLAELGRPPAAAGDPEAANVVLRGALVDALAGLDDGPADDGARERVRLVLLTTLEERPW